MSTESDAKLGDNWIKIMLELEDKIISAIKNKNYGREVEDISIIPVIVDLPPEHEAAGFFKERMLFKRKSKEADYRLRINFNKFNKADDKLKRLLLTRNIVESIRNLGVKAKKDFDAESLENDILECLGINKEEIEGISLK